MKNYILSIFILLFSTFTYSQEIPDLKGRVNFNGSYQPTESQKQELIKSLQDLDKSGKVQMAILVVDSVKPYTIEQYSIKVAEKWKVGQKNVNNGVIFVVATKDKKARLEVGRGLEGVLTDALTSRIQKDKMVPLFKKGDFFGGIKAVVGEVKVHTAKEIPTIKAEMDKQDKSSSNSIAIIVVSIFGVGIFGFFFWLLNNNKKKKLKQEEELNALRQQWRDEYINNQRKYRPIAPTSFKSSANKSNSIKKSSSSNLDDVATGAILGSILSSSSDDDSRKSSSSSDSFSSGGGDYSGGGSSSDW